MMMILQNGARLGAPVVLVYDGSPLAKKALQAALALLDEESEEEALTVLTVGEGLEDCRRLRAEVEDELPPGDLNVRYRILSTSTAEKVAYRVRMEERGTVVLPAKKELVDNEALKELLTEIDVPVLLVR